MVAVRVEVPPENLRIPVSEFGLVWNTAEQGFAKEPGPYVAGVVAACRWMAGYDGALSPIGGDRVAATPGTIVDEDMLATPIPMRSPGHDRSVDWRYAAGVAATLGWARGVLSRSPLGAVLSA